MTDKDKIRADVSDLLSRSTRKKARGRSSTVHITIGNDSMVVLGDGNIVGKRRQEDDAEDDPASHGRRDADQAVRAELAALRYRVRALTRLIEHLMANR